MNELKLLHDSVKAFKRYVGQSVVLDISGLVNADIVEAWTNINSAPNNYHAVKSKNNKIELRCNESGFFKLQIRYKNKSEKSWSWIKKDGEILTYDLQVDPEWFQKAVVYNAFVRSFGAKKITTHGNIERLKGGTFDDLKQRLKDLKKLGVNVIYLNPVHAIGELLRKTDIHDSLPEYLQPGSPYSIKDYKSIDPEFAWHKEHGKYVDSDQYKEFKELVDAAHKLGIRVFMDLVFNHTSHDSVFQRQHPEWYLYKENITDHESPYIYPEEIAKGKPWGDPKHTVAPFDHGFFWEDVAQLNWEYNNPPAPNDPPKNPTLDSMYEYFKSIPKYWIKNFGIDGFRCDVSYRVPMNFWNECIYESRLEAKKSKNLDKDVVYIAETYVDKLNELLIAGFTCCYGDYHNKLFSPLTLKGYLDYIYNISGRFFPDGTPWFLFPECHDWIRLPEKLVGQTKTALGSYLGNKSRWALTALLPGIPMIFNGFEKAEFNQVSLFSYSKINWDHEHDLGEFISKINKIRKNEVFIKGDYLFIPSRTPLENSNLFSFVRSYNKEKFLVVVNMNVNEEVCELLDVSSLKLKNYELHDLLHNKKFLRNGNDLTILLPPGEVHVFKIIQKQ